MIEIYRPSNNLYSTLFHIHTIITQCVLFSVMLIRQEIPQIDYQFIQIARQLKKAIYAPEIYSKQEVLDAL